jgi:serine/threonine-protein kinase ATR
LTFLDSLLNSVAGLLTADPKSTSVVLPFAAEASWRTGRLEDFERLLENEEPLRSHDFNVGIGRALLALKKNGTGTVSEILTELRHSVMTSLSPSTAASLANARSHLVRLHAIHEIDLLSKARTEFKDDEQLAKTLNERLDILGSLTEDKQYILGIRRAALKLTRFGNIS